MTTLSVDEAIARVPQWNGRQDIQVSFLAGGITNKNYKVEVGDEAFVLRIVGEDTELLGVNREVEYQANSAAGTMGIAPEVIYLIQPEQCLVTRFIKGREMSQDEIGQPENIRRVMETLKAIHALPTVTYEFIPYRFVEQCAQIAARYQVRFPDRFDWMIDQMHAIESALGVHAGAQQLCHNDLLNANFLLDEQDDRLYVLDWEYAGMGDPFFDLANFSAHHEFSDEQDRHLLQAYFGDVSRQNNAHLKLMRIISDHREAMWGLVQIGISSLDFDFRDYADKHFTRMTGNLNNPRYPQWLKDAQA
jgi:thiamine kinase-like enzyme